MRIWRHAWRRLWSGDRGVDTDNILVSIILLQLCFISFLYPLLSLPPTISREGSRPIQGKYEAFPGCGYSFSSSSPP